MSDRPAESAEQQSKAPGASAQPDGPARDGGHGEGGPRLGDLDAGRGIREITDVETLKVLADPTRLAILTALMQGPARQPPLMSVKELAAELGEPQTKLYRHVRQLETAGLIRAAASRMVSGILEQRYEACQRDVTLGPGLIQDRASADEFEAAVTEIIKRYISMFFAAYRAGTVLMGGAEGDSLNKGVFQMTESRVTAARAAAIRAALRRITEELNEASRDDPEDGVPVNVLIAFYSPSQAPPG
ncbi:MAG TPA: winged helix-turn-helix domain-containing protein [Streptosporangiaceae bacterium]|jgi:DNA-binding transcriptional ArsR family regulator